MLAIQLHDKYTEEIIGTVLITQKAVTFDDITKAWDKYQETHNSNTEKQPDIHEFVAEGNWDMCEVLDLEFYQP
jgi:hypothetical protein